MTALGERSDEPAVSLKTWIAVGGGLLAATLWTIVGSRISTYNIWLP